MRIDLTDTTFIIPVRIDSMIRLENLLMSVDSIVRYFRTRILILEASSYQNEIIPSLIKDDTVKYTFLVDKDPVFYKTKYLNILAKQVDTPLVCIWDADVILDHLQILDAVKQLRTRTSDVAYPYDGNFLDTSDILREHYWLHRDLDFREKSLWHLQNIKNERALHKIQKVGNDMATVLISAFCSALHSNNSSAAKVMRICE